MIGCSYTYRNEIVKVDKFPVSKKGRYSIAIQYDHMNFYEKENSTSGDDIALRMMAIKKSVEETGLFSRVNVVFDNYTGNQEKFSGGEDFFLTIKSIDNYNFSSNTAYEVLACLTLFIVPFKSQSESNFLATLYERNSRKESVFQYRATATSWTSLFLVFALPFMDHGEIKILSRYRDAGRYFVQKMVQDGYFK